jgi:hypothetical protein
MVIRHTGNPDVPLMVEPPIRCATLLGNDRVVVGTDWGLFVADARTGEGTLLPGHTGTVLDLAPSPDDRFLLSGSVDQTLRIWYSEPSGLHEVCTIFITDNRDEYVVWTPSGPYAASQGARPLVGWTDDLGPTKMRALISRSERETNEKEQYLPDTIKLMAMFMSRRRVSEDEVLRWIETDLRGMKEDERRWARYFIFTHIYNALLDRHANNPWDHLIFYDLRALKKLDTYRHGLSKLVNSLSWAYEIKVPEPVDAAGLVVRIRLQDYEWNEKTWQQILAEYPFGVVRQTSTAKAVAAATGCALPYVHADWFAFAASRPPLYHNLLKLPDTAEELERLLSVNPAEDEKDGSTLRIGLQVSLVTYYNRILERHPIRKPDIEGGYYWRTYDFAGCSGRRNIFTHPLGPGPEDRYFQHDAGEILFSLNNGLQGYFLVDQQGRRIDQAPSVIARDFERARIGDATVINGISCISCHRIGINSYQYGQTDQTWATVKNNPAAYSASDFAAIERFHHNSNVRRDVNEQDYNYFILSSEESDGSTDTAEPVQELATYYSNRPDITGLAPADMDLPQAAADADLAPEVFRQKALSSSPQLYRLLSCFLDSRIGARIGTMNRRSYVEAFPLMVQEWRLGSLLNTARLDESNRSVLWLSLAAVICFIGFLNMLFSFRR